MKYGRRCALAPAEAHVYMGPPQPAVSLMQYQPGAMAVQSSQSLPPDPHAQL
jgi:hypothetical protein